MDSISLITGNKKEKKKKKISHNFLYRPSSKEQAILTSGLFLKILH